MQPLRRSFAVQGIGILLSLLLRVSPTLADEVPAVPPLFEIRSVAAEAGADTEAMTVNEAKGPKVLYVRKEVILDLADVYAARSIAGMETSLGIDFTKRGAERYLDYSTSHIGERLAIVISGKLVAAPLIKGPITGGRIAIGPLPGSTALDLANRISELLRK